MKWWMVVAGLVLLILLLVWGWSRYDFMLADISLLGDALAPLVGILSLGAVVAALYSVHLQGEALASQERAIGEQLQLQRDALKKQDEEIKLQADALQQQLQLQRDALIKQDEEIKRQVAVLQQERVLQRQAALRAAYTPFVVAVQHYVDLVDGYIDWLRTNYRLDKPRRRMKQAPIEAAYADVERAAVTPRLLDGDDERNALRYQLAAAPIQLDPPLDTSRFQQEWPAVIRYDWMRRTIDATALQHNLVAEFGRPYVESQKDKDHVAKTLAVAKAEADKVEHTIKEALHGGPVPPG